VCDATQHRAACLRAVRSATQQARQPGGRSAHSRWQGEQQQRGGSLPCISRPAVDQSALDSVAATDVDTADVPAADNVTHPQAWSNGTPQNGSNGAHPAEAVHVQPRQSPAASPAALLTAVYRFSRPHTMFGTFVSVCSVSALALVSDLACHLPVLSGTAWYCLLLLIPYKYSSHDV
jgi:hypothetical protein